MSARIEPQRLLAAEVIVRAASGRPLTGKPTGEPTGESTGEPITRDTLAAHLPDPEALAHAREAFAALGFTVGAPAPLGFAITAAAATFERVFGVQLVALGDPDEGVGGGVGVRAEAGPPRSELPLTALPVPLAARLEAVVFAPPPEFGPGAFPP